MKIEKIVSFVLMICIFILFFNIKETYAGEFYNYGYDDNYDYYSRDARGPSMLGIYDALIRDPKGWMNAPATYWTGIQSYNRNSYWSTNPTWTGEYIASNSYIYQAIGAFGSRLRARSWLINGKYAFCAGHRIEQTVTNDPKWDDLKYIRVLDINLPDTATVVDGNGNKGNRFPLKENKMEISTSSDWGEHIQTGDMKDIDENTRNRLNKHAQILAIYAAKATYEEENEPYMYITKSESGLRQYMKDHYEDAFKPLFQVQRDSTLDDQYVNEPDKYGYVTADEMNEIEELAGWIQSETLTTIKIEDYKKVNKTIPSITYKNVERVGDANKKDTLIGPYSVEQKYGKITEIEIELEDGTKKTDLYYIVNDKDRTYKISDESYKQQEVGMNITKGINISKDDNFYIAVPDEEISNIKSIKLKKSFKNYQARIAMTFGITTGEQAICMYYGQSFQDEQTCELPLPPKPTLTIKKTDANTGASLTNARFVIKNVDKKKYIKKEGETISYVDNIEQATEFKTEEKVTLSEVGKYSVLEVKAENENYPKASKTESGAIKIGDDITLTFGQNGEVKATNQRHTEMILQKTDETTGAKLENTRFVIKQVSGNNNNNNKYLVAGNPVTYVSDIKRATQFAPFETIKHIEIYEDTTYQIYEVQEQDSGYEDADISQPIEMKDQNGNPLKVTLKPGTTNTPNINYSNNNIINMTNKRKYINLSGYVWEDIASGKNMSKNQLYDSNDKDKLLEGITVELKHTKDEKKSGSITTNREGKYVFEKIEIDELPNYYVEFRYNGIAYQNVISEEFKCDDEYIKNEDIVDGIAHANKQNSNRAMEKDNRTTFNSKYETISYKASNAYKLNYDYNAETYKSKLNYRRWKLYLWL